MQTVKMMNEISVCKWGGGNGRHKYIGLYILDPQISQPYRQGGENSQLEDLVPFPNCIYNLQTIIR